MKIWATRNRHRWALGVAYSWEKYDVLRKHDRMLVVQGGPFVVWVRIGA